MASFAEGTAFAVEPASVGRNFRLFGRPYSFRLDRRGPRLPGPHDRGRHPRHPGRPDRSARRGVRMDTREHLARDRDQHLHLRIHRPLRGRRHAALRDSPCRPLRARPSQRYRGPQHPHHGAMAAHSHLGRLRRHRQRVHGHGPRRDRGGPLVYRAPRPRHGHARRQPRHRSADFPARPRVGDCMGGLAAGGVDHCCRRGRDGPGRLLPFARAPR